MCGITVVDTQRYRSLRTVLITRDYLTPQELMTLCVGQLKNSFGALLIGDTVYTVFSLTLAHNYITFTFDLASATASVLVWCLA